MGVNNNGRRRFSDADLLAYARLSGANFTGTIKVPKLENNGTSTPSAITADGQYQIYASSGSGLVLIGRGGVLDVLIANKNSASILWVPTGSTNIHANGLNVGNRLSVGASYISESVHDTGFQFTTGSIISSNGLGSYSKKNFGSVGFEWGFIRADEFRKTGGLATQSLQANGASVNLASGSFSPTITNPTNCSSITVSPQTWSYIGAIVSISGHIQLTCTTSGNISFELNLPANGNDFTTVSQLCGNASSENALSPFVCGNFSSIIGTKKALFKSNLIGGITYNFYYNYTYQII